MGVGFFSNILLKVYGVYDFFSGVDYYIFVFIFNFFIYNKNNNNYYYILYCRGSNYGKECIKECLWSKGCD